MSRYQVSWSKDGSLGKGEKSAPMTHGEAIALANTKRKGNRTVNILKEGLPPNEGKFFLDRIVK